MAQTRIIKNNCFLVLISFFIPVAVFSQHVAHFNIPACPSTGVTPYAPHKDSPLLFPNPASGTFFISRIYNNEEVLPEVEVFDMIGKQQAVTILNLLPELMQVDISMLKKGAYIVQIISGRKRLQKSLIVY